MKLRDLARFLKNCHFPPIIKIRWCERGQGNTNVEVVIAASELDPETVVAEQADELTAKVRQNAESSLEISTISLTLRCDCQEFGKTFELVRWQAESLVIKCEECLVRLISVICLVVVQNGRIRSAVVCGLVHAEAQICQREGFTARCCWRDNSRGARIDCYIRVKSIHIQCASIWRANSRPRKTPSSNIELFDGRVAKYLPNRGVNAKADITSPALREIVPMICVDWVCNQNIGQVVRAVAR